MEIPDLPGALSDLTRLVGDLNSNIIDIVHQRAFGGSSVRSTLVELALQGMVYVYVENLPPDFKQIQGDSGDSPYVQFDGTLLVMTFVTEHKWMQEQQEQQFLLQRQREQDEEEGA